MTVEAQQLYADAVRFIAEEFDVAEVRMMGMPALKIGSTMFGGFFDNTLVVKIGRERAQALIAAGNAQPFDPSGRDRPMRDWARIPPPADNWIGLLREAAQRAIGSGDIIPEHRPG